ncbi:MAG: signal transduction histidine kinase/CheY-like chemotaxis protein [Enterobacterales bacterium]|jgi:signal transduction histidine kinase/CheY-like chemotaxis protein
MKFRIAFFILLTVVFFRSASLLSENQAKEQSDFLTVVATENNLPFSFRLPDGSPSGLYVEFWRIWSKTNNIPIRFVMVPFDEGLQLTRQKNTLHVGLFKNNQREQWADFSSPIHNVQSGIIYNRSINKKTKLRELNDIKVSTQRFSYQESYIRENHPDIEQSTYENVDDAFNQLLNNDVQALFAELPTVFAQLAKKGLLGVFVISEEVIVSNNVLAVIAKGQPELLAKVNAGIESIPVDEIIALEKKWLPTLEPFFKKLSTVSSLTGTEIKWLSQNNSFSLGTDASWAPFEFNDEQGEYSGISADYMKYAQQQLQINLKPTLGLGWAEALEEFKLGNVDVMSAILYTEERAQYINFTNPYAEVSLVIASKQDGFYAEGLSSLGGKKLGLIKGYVFKKLINRDYPNINTVDVVSVVDGLKKLQSGEIDAFVDSIAVINYEINKNEFNDIIITSFTPYKLEISMAVRKGLEPLIPILNKTFAAMDEKQRSAIANNWLSVHVQTGTKSSTIVLWALPILSLLMLIIFWVIRNNRLLATEVNSRYKVELKLIAEKSNAEKANLAKDNFLANMSHEIRTPMNAVLGMSQILSESGLTSEQQNNNDILYSSASSLLSLLNDILDLSKIEAGKIELDNQAFTLKDVIGIVIHQQQVLLANKDVLLSVNIAPSVPKTLNGDSFRLNQIVTNLINNAIKFTEQGEISLSIKPIKTEGSIINIEFSLSDTGIGMTTKEMSNLFDTYNQADSSTTRKYGGTGLGLSICKKLVELMGGTITVVSKPKNGSCFTFNVFFDAVEQAKVVNDSNDIKSLSQTKKHNFKVKYKTLKGKEVLLVDDNPVNIIVASSHLKNVGIRVTTATNGQEAIDAVKANNFDAVLMDIQMPIMDGLDASRAIRNDLKLIDLPIIALSANVMTDDENKSLNAGMNAHIGKPIDIDMLFSTLSAYI